MSVQINKLAKSEVEIQGEIEAGAFEAYYPKALQKVAEHIEIDGFRKGKAPENVLLAKVGEMTILEEMANLAINEEYPKILEQEKIDAISRPVITITKLARNNPLGFTIHTAVLPVVRLPDYKNIAKKVTSGLTDKDKDSTVSDEELENTILDIRKARAPKTNLKDLAQSTKEGEHTEPAVEDLPELNDEFVKGLGPFENVADFRQKLRENLQIEKVNTLKEKTRIKIVEEILEATEVELPQILIDIELDKILYKMESDISQMGLKFEDYLTHINKTKEDLRKEFTDDAAKKAKLSLVLHEISKVEKIVVDKEALAKEVAHILAHYKDADPVRVEMHAENVLVNEMIFDMLEKA